MTSKRIHVDLMLISKIVKYSKVVHIRPMDDKYESRQLFAFQLTFPRVWTWRIFNRMQRRESWEREITRRQ
jgi:hypothetical protein